MSTNILTTQSRATASIGSWIPTVAVRAASAAVAVGLCLLTIPSPFWRGMGLLLAACSFLFPSTVPAWTVIVLLCANQIERHPSAGDARVYLLLAGVHLLHILASLSRVVPRGARLQLAALRRPLARFLRIQIVVQITAVATLTLFGESPGTLRGLSVLSAAALGALALVLSRGLRPRAVQMD